MKRKIILLIILIISSAAISAKATDVTFKLPYPSQQKFILVNGYNALPTHIHKDSYALDFTKNGCEAYGISAIASRSGVVSLVLDESKSGGYGYVVDVSFGNGMVARYAHLIAASIIVKIGDNVQAGQEIGKIGNTGLVMGNACPSYPGTHLHFAVYQKQADGTLAAYKPEPISGYTSLLAGNWYASDNTVYTPVYAASGGSEQSPSPANPQPQANQTAAGAASPSPKTSLLSAVINGVENLAGQVADKITSAVGNTIAALKSSVADIFNSNSTDDGGGGMALDNQPNSGDQPIDNSLASAGGNNQVKSQGKILNNDGGGIAQAGDNSGQSISQPSAPAASDDDSHSQPDVKPAENENQNLKNLQNSSTSLKLSSSTLPNSTSSTNDQNFAKNNTSQEKTPVAAASCSFGSGVGQTSSRQILINEVAWMGSANSANDEWIEIKNISSQEIDLKNWQLAGKDDDFKINLSSLKNTKIAPQGFALLERTDDSSVPGVAADLVYAGSLANSDEGLRLFDGSCRLVDEVLANPNWPAGNNITKQTMERDLIGFGWHSSMLAGGTPKRENSQIYSGGGGGGTSQSNNQQSDNQTNQQAVASKPEIIINEIMYNLEGVDDGREWLEIFNSGTTTADLTDWKLYDGQSNHGLNLARGSVIIEPGAYAIISNGTDKFLADNSNFNGAILESSFSLNNSGETLSLKDENDNIIGQAGYSSSMGANGDGLSLQKINGVWQPALPTPGEENKISPNEAEKALNVSFGISPASPEAGEEVVFLASSTEPDKINYYQWDFGYSSSSSGQIISTTSTFVGHIFENPGNYEIKLSAFSDNASSSYSSVISVSSSTKIAEKNNESSSSLADSVETHQVFISEIKAGGVGNADDEFIEIYNPTDQEIALSGWSLKRKTSSSSAELKNLVSEFPTSSITSKSFFLIASSDYSGPTIPDVRYSNNSNNLAYKNDVLILKNNNSEIVDEVYYSEIPAGYSLERKANASSTAQSMVSGDDRFLGNNYESGDDSFDFVIQDNPNPQNYANLPKPRNKPTIPAALNATSEIAVYNSSAGQIVFNWLPSQDARGATSTLSYEIFQIGESSSSSLTAETTSTELSYPISAAGQFNFSVQAFDGEGLGSEMAYVDLFIQAADDSTSSEQSASTQLSDALPTSTVIFSQPDDSSPLTTITSFISGSHTYTYPWDNKSGQTFLAARDENLDKIEVSLWANQGYNISCGWDYAFLVYLNLYDAGLADNLGSLAFVASSSADALVERCANRSRQTIPFDFPGGVNLSDNHFYYFELNVPGSNSYWEIGLNGTTTDVVSGSYYYNGTKYPNYDGYGFLDGTFYSAASSTSTDSTSTLIISGGDFSAAQNADSTIAIATSTLSATSTDSISATSTLLLADLNSDLGLASSTDSDAAGTSTLESSTSTLSGENSSTTGNNFNSSSTEAGASADNAASSTQATSTSNEISSTEPAPVFAPGTIYQYSQENYRRPIDSYGENIFSFSPSSSGYLTQIIILEGFWPYANGAASEGTSDQTASIWTFENGVPSQKAASSGSIGAYVHNSGLSDGGGWDARFTFDGSYYLESGKTYGLGLEISNITYLEPMAKFQNPTPAGETGTYYNASSPTLNAKLNFTALGNVKQ